MLPETRLFFSRWLANPLRVGALYPSSSGLSKVIAGAALCSPDQVVLELGAGTGAVGQAMMENDPPPGQLMMVERDAVMADHLRARFPEAAVVQGDALRPATVVPDGWGGRITVCVSGVPILGRCSLVEQRRFVEELAALMGGSLRLIQYTNSPVAPLLHRDLGLEARRVGFAWSGVFPHYVWEFRSA